MTPTDANPAVLGKHPSLATGEMVQVRAIDALQSGQGDGSLLAVATGSYIGEGFDCPALDTVFLVFPMKSKGQVVQYVGRILRSHPGKVSVEVHDYVDECVPVLAYTHARRSAAYASLGFVTPT